MSKSQKRKHNLPDEIVKAIYVDNVVVVYDWKNADNIDYIDNDNRTMLFHAILSGRYNIVISLLKSNSSVNLKDKKGWSPLHYAVQNHRVKITELLLNNNADKEIKDDYGNTPLWRAVFASQGKGEIIKLLLENGANPNNENNSGISPLALAKTIANYDVAQFFE